MGHGDLAVLVLKFCCCSFRVAESTSVKDYRNFFDRKTSAAVSFKLLEKYGKETYLVSGKKKITSTKYMTINTR